MPGPKTDRSKYTLGSPESKQRVAAEKTIASTPRAAPAINAARAKSFRQKRKQRVRRALTTVRKAYAAKTPDVSGLDRHQDQVLDKILDVGRRKGSTNREDLSAVETGLVESSLRNLDYGDADSKGWRQERASIYGSGRTGPRNVKASARRFYDELRTEGAGQRTPGLAAQAAQGSAHPERYDEREAEARGILREYRRKASRVPRGTKVAKARKTLKIAGVKAPQRAATPQKSKGLWRGKKAPFSTGSLTPEQAAVTTPARKMAKKIAGISGEKVELISGVRPGAVTTTGNVSDHASGNALDIHALDQTSSGGGTAQDKRRGDRIAKAAMIAAGIPAKKADGYVQGDGPVEVNTYHNGYRVQILWRTDTGGNHHNHVHVGIRAEDGSGTSVVSGGVGGPLAASTGSSSGGTPVRGKRRSGGRAEKKRKLARVRAAYSSPADSSSSDSELDELEKRYGAAV